MKNKRSDDPLLFALPFIIAALLIGALFGVGWRDEGYPLIISEKFVADWALVFLTFILAMYAARTVNAMRQEQRENRKLFIEREKKRDIVTRQEKFLQYKHLLKNLDAASYFTEDSAQEIKILIDAATDLYGIVEEDVVNKFRHAMRLLEHIGRLENQFRKTSKLYYRLERRRSFDLPDKLAFKAIESVMNEAIWDQQNDICILLRFYTHICFKKGIIVNWAELRAEFPERPFDFILTAEDILRIGRRISIFRRKLERPKPPPTGDRR